jgi:heat shock protein HtpX
MEMCIDDPRTGFANLFDTHPSVDARVKALVDFAGGHDPGPLEIEAPESPEDEQGEQETPEALPRGPWNQQPDQPQDQQGQTQRPSGGPWGTSPPTGGPWGNRDKTN